jgi:hypothetical protein
MLVVEPGGGAMSANLYCWEPSLNLEPASDDFQQKIQAIHQYVRKPTPSAAMIKLVDALIARYPDLSLETLDTVWADGPMKNNILGQFINMSIRWDNYVEAAEFVISTAHSQGLHVYDPQDGSFYPAPGTT